MSIPLVFLAFMYLELFLCLFVVFCTLWANFKTWLENISEFESDLCYHHKEMAERRRRHPDCPSASNPYHVCAEYCYQKIEEAASKTRKDKKVLDCTINKDGELKKMAGERKVHPTCNNTFNPYHECAEYCFKNSAVKRREPGKESGSFGRRKNKGSESQPHSPLSNGSANLHSPAKKKMDERNGVPSSSDGIRVRDSSFNMKLYQSSQVMPIAGFAKPGHSKEQSKSSRNSLANGIQAKEEEFGKLPATPTKQTLRSLLLSEDAWGNARSVSDSTGCSVGLQATSRNNKEVAESDISDSGSRVWVGKYHVRSSIASTLKTILDRHGDIAAACQLESLAVRAYYLECLCFVIHDLQSTPLKHLKKSKVKEMLAILKDIEFAQINVGWLRNVLNQITEVLEVIDQQRVAELTKSSCDQEVEKTKEDMKIQLEELAQKEKEVVDTKAQIGETKARLNKLELTSSQAKETMTSLASKVDKINCKAMLDELL